MHKILVTMFGMILLSGAGAAQSPPESPVPPDAEVRKILVERIE